MRWIWGKFTVHVGNLARAISEKALALHQKFPFLKRKMWAQSHFSIQNGKNNYPVNTRCTNHLKGGVKYLLLNGTWNRPFHKMGTPRFLLSRATGSISWHFKNRCAWAQDARRELSHWRRLKSAQDLWGHTSSHPLSVSHIGPTVFVFFWWQICYIIHLNRHDHYSWQIGLIPDILPLIMQLCLWLFRANPQDGWSLPKSSQPPPSSPQGKIRFVLLWVWQLSLFQVS